MRHDIVALGEAMVEFTETDIPGYGPHYRMGFGGDTSNAVIAAARQGARTAYLTAVGADMFGAALVDLWDREGVDHTGVRHNAQAPTGVYFIRPHATGRDFTYLRQGSAASRMSATDLPLDLISGARALHVSAISQAISPSMRDAVTTAIGVARKAGALVSYDTNLRLALWPLDTARQAIFESLGQTDIIFPSDDEARSLTGLTEISELLDRFVAFGARLVVLKCGADGAWIADGARHIQIPPAASEPVDSTGCGDSFAGAYLAYYLETGDAERAGHLAARVAAGTVSGVGAVQPIPYRADVWETT